MIKLLDAPQKLKAGRLADAQGAAPGGTMAEGILAAHNQGGGEGLSIRFDALASHDITYVGIVQTARASGLTEFPMPYVLTNCHNSLCAVGGTINEDDHRFGLSAAVKYGGIYVPSHMAVIHQYMRECFAGGGKMILGSDSHTRYGALGTLGVGEGGPELVKQLCGRTYDIARPPVIAVYLEGSPRPGVGPQDVALAIIAAVFERGFVKNKVMEFIGPGVAGLTVEYRHGIDVMTTETTCLSSVWQTDEKVKNYLALHGRSGDYKAMAPADGAVYDGAVLVDLGAVEPMIALPFHPSRALPIREFNMAPADRLREVEKDALEQMGQKVDLMSKVKNGRMMVDQAVIAGCSGGTFENLCIAADILSGHTVGDGELALSIYPASQPQYLALLECGAAADLMRAGATLRSAFCGPCFGAGDVPFNGGLSIRHATRNFPSREGAKPSDGQFACVALMDARSIAATVANGGILTAADEIDLPPAKEYAYKFDTEVYASRVYNGWGKPQKDAALKFGPNIADWPAMIPLPEDLLLTVACAIYDPVTTTDELIPSGETSSYRSNPLRLAEFALSRKDPAYVGRAKAILAEETARREAGESRVGLGSVVFARKPGDGSAREQAASCQRVLGGVANIAVEYATKRYRSNLINWGMLPFQLKDASQLDALAFAPGDKVYIPDVRKKLLAKEEEYPAQLWRGGDASNKIAFTLMLPALGDAEREILLDGCLINHYAKGVAR